MAARGFTPKHFQPLPRTKILYGNSQIKLDSSDIHKSKERDQLPWNKSTLMHETNNSREEQMRKSIERLSTGEGVREQDGEIYVPVKVTRIPIEKIKK